MRTLTRGALTALIVAAIGLLAAAPASAHEGRTVNGKYSFVVGWGDEPAYNGFKNSVQLILSDTGHHAITDLGDTLKVEVISGAQKVTLPFEPNFEVGEFGEPGDYRAWLVPTKPGGYSFHITGTIRGDAIDQTFTSGDKTFDEIKSVSEVEFPSKDPTTGELATRLQRVEDRATKAADHASDSASSARVLAIVGIALGVAGIVIAVVGARRR